MKKNDEVKLKIGEEVKDIGTYLFTVTDRKDKIKKDLYKALKRFHGMPDTMTNRHKLRKYIAKVLNNHIENVTDDMINKVILSLVNNKDEDKDNK